MEYIFGHERINGKDEETLKTIGADHSDLKGRMSVVRKYSDNDITDTFTVREKYRTAEDEEENCYDWYIIDGHYRYTDKFTPKSGDITDSISACEDAILELAELIG